MNNGILKKTYLFVFVVTLLISVSSISYAKVNISYMNGANSSKKMHIPTAVSKISTGIFRGSRATINRKAFRVDNAPYTGRGISKRQHKKQPTNKRGRTRVRLFANLPSGLGIKSKDVKWQITSAKGRSAAKMSGNSATVRLNPGIYNVKLKIGRHYTKTEKVTIRKSRNKSQIVPITTRLGLLKVSSSLNGNNSNTRKIRWTAKNKKGVIVARGRGHKFNTLVPAGKYKVEAHYDNAKRGKNITVQQGAVGRGTIKLPASSIKISAYNNNLREPMFSSTSWVIYDQNNRAVARSKKHNFRVTLFPGKYRAKLKAKGKTTEKRFVVSSSGRNAEVNVIVKK